MALNPNFMHKSRVAVAQLSVANANRDGTGSIATVLTGGPIGTKLERLVIVATGATTAGMIRLYLHDGSAARLIQEVPVTAITPSASVAAFAAEVDLSTAAKLLMLPDATWSLRASTEKAEVFHLFAIGGDFS